MEKKEERRRTHGGFGTLLVLSSRRSIPARARSHLVGEVAVRRWETQRFSHAILREYGDWRYTIYIYTKGERGRARSRIIGGPPAAGIRDRVWSQLRLSALGTARLWIFYPPVVVVCPFALFPLNFLFSFWNLKYFRVHLFSLNCWTRRVCYMQISILLFLYY